MRQSNYDKAPFVAVPGGFEVLKGWPAICHGLKERLRGRAPGVLVVDTYPGVNDAELLVQLESQLRPALTVRTLDLKKPEPELLNLIGRNLTDDRIFGVLSCHTLEEFFDSARLREARRTVELQRDGLVLVYGVGAVLVARGDVLVHADLARWEIQLRYRRGLDNWGANNGGEDFFRKYKRGFFVEWRVADRHKFSLFDRVDFFLDTHTPGQPKCVEGRAVREGLHHAATRPFRVVPFFDPAPWGGQWMKEVCNLDRSVHNYGWCFDCVPEENSLLLGFGSERIELPSLDVVGREPVALLGDEVHARFGREFPIRFDFLDTMGGGNLSLQVHPLTEYIQQHFGMHYTQDESYYILDAGPGASVYLGLREGIDPKAMIGDLEGAQAGGGAFATENYINQWPAKKHDHFLIPAGTVHCSGSGSMVLEISATPYIFTFKMWDWGRVGLDGKPRPIHLNHGVANIQWDRTTRWVKDNLLNRVEPVASGDGWREERTGLHEREFIETRRHWFTKAVPHDTCGGVQVLNLVEGEEALVESPDGKFKPFVVHYAETFIVPAAVGRYTMRPQGLGSNQRCATMKAFVRSGIQQCA
ncbi:MAG TPA: class I mannose-6-phosphate isomerase [Verrucomicrobiae bacterium]|nr:class I mannose-6-phosphate isomerase [Verrucomicrobiae bacterium]